jgi:hypothetical protein
VELFGDVNALVEMKLMRLAQTLNLAIKRAVDAYKKKRQRKLDMII